MRAGLLPSYQFSGLAYQVFLGGRGSYMYIFFAVRFSAHGRFCWGSTGRVNLLHCTR